uniref:Uncharacterized protein n=1 Tax=Arundo donax TaxID=35708 RepID=A0A0A9I2S4_ARUDO
MHPFSFTSGTWDTFLISSSPMISSCSLCHCCYCYSCNGYS